MNPILFRKFKESIYLNSKVVARSTSQIFRIFQNSLQSRSLSWRPSSTYVQQSYLWDQDDTHSSPSKDAKSGRSLLLV